MIYILIILMVILSFINPIPIHKSTAFIQPPMGGIEIIILIIIIIIFIISIIICFWNKYDIYSKIKKCLHIN